MKKTFLIICFGVLVSFPFVSLAAGLVPCGGDNEPPCQFCHIFVMFSNVVNFLLTYVIPSVAVLMIAIGGFMYLFAYLSPDQGGPNLLAQAKRLIISVIVGLVIIFAAWLIVNFFFQAIGVQTWTGLEQGWWKIDCPVTTSNPGQQTTVNSNPNASSTSVSFTDFQASLADAISNYYSGSSNLTESELKDLLAVYPSLPVSSVGLTGTGFLSGEKLIDIYNKAKNH